MAKYINEQKATTQTSFLVPTRSSYKQHISITMIMLVKTKYLIFLYHATELTCMM